MDDAELATLLDVDGTPGWGFTRAVTIDGIRVFTKSVPVTALELAHPGATHNLHELPALYSYGVGSAGFGVFRELALHDRTTRWVLDGDADAFPLTYHHRILPGPYRGKRRTPEELDAYQAYWDDHASIRRFVQARQESEHQAVVFLEYIPHVLHTWLEPNLERVPAMMPAFRRTLAFLGAHGVRHFDAHLSNVLTDGERLYLADFGLALDRSWDLSGTEQSFFDAHAHYDDALFSACLFRPLYALVRSWDDDAKAAMSARFGDATIGTLARNLEALCADGTLSLPPDYLALLQPWAELVGWMDGFLGALSDGRKADAVWNDPAVAALLQKA